MPHCPTCTCTAGPLPDSPDKAVAALVAAGVDTIPAIARALSGGREPDGSELEWVRRIAERGVRAGRLTRTREAGWQRKIGAPPVRYALP